MTKSCPVVLWRIPPLVWVVSVLLALDTGATAQFVTDFNPKFAQVGHQNSAIVITGSGFNNGNVAFLSFNGVFVGGAITSDTQINVTDLPTNVTTGFICVHDTNQLPLACSSQQFIITGPGPYFTGFSNAFGQAGTTVTITGLNFNPPTVTSVKFNGVEAAIVNTATTDQIGVQVPAGATTGPITVATTSGTNSTATNFFVKPIITGFSPTSGISGDSITISGTNFLGATQVIFGLLPAAGFTPSDNFSIAATVPVGAKRGKIFVSTPAGTVFSTNNFLVPPKIFSFTPTNGPVGTLVTIAGTNFLEVTSVTIGGASATINSSNVAGNQLTATVPAGGVSGPITVTTLSGADTTTNKFFLPPAITSVQPNGGIEGDPVSINGSNLTDVLAVKFNGVAAVFATNPIIANQLTTTVPHGALTGRITVQTPGGIATNSENFLILPAITGFAPAGAPPGDTVVITGTNFTTNASVVFSASVPAVTTYISLNEVRATVPTNAVSGRLRVATDGGVAVSSEDFTVLSLLTSLVLTRTNGAAVVSWPTNVDGWRLQGAASLTPVINWTNNTAPTSVVSGRFTVTNPAATPASFFRLVRP
ncbi:MAG: IPT/TIG domain-containing protein [Verrucomicrobia bacterium]|nr:IPT/TIG domain-containing protein [Verrucomicrobiota bacterium]